MAVVAEVADVELKKQRMQLEVPKDHFRFALLMVAARHAAAVQ